MWNILGTYIVTINIALYKLLHLKTCFSNDCRKKDKNIFCLKESSRIVTMFLSLEEKQLQFRYY